jgi:zinc/manganese transport system ATP-binding protein
VHALELNRVTLARGGRTIVSDVNATIAMGEFIGILGPNGAGKTSLLHAILGLLTPSSGDIRLLGARIARGNRDVGYLPQQRRELADLHIRGWDFVACALRGERWGLPWRGRSDRSEVDWAINAVEAGALAARTVRELSGGELQRLLLAQALLGRPHVLMLDEPLLNLDPRFQDAAVALVRTLARTLGITVLFTAHDLNPLLGAMDRVLYLGHGRSAIGSVDEVITSAVLSNLYQTDIEVVRLWDRIIVVSGHGPLESQIHGRDA